VQEWRRRPELKVSNSRPAGFSASPSLSSTLTVVLIKTYAVFWDLGLDTEAVCRKVDSAGQTAGRPRINTRRAGKQTARQTHLKCTTITGLQKSLLNLAS
jgi:hypothetical protein